MDWKIRPIGPAEVNRHGLAVIQPAGGRPEVVNDLIFKIKLELMASDDEDFIWIFEHNLYERIKFTDGFPRHRSIDGLV